MEKESFTKKYNFRLPDRTIEQLDEMIEDGVIQNRTDGVVLAVERLYNNERTADDELQVFKLLLLYAKNNPDRLNELHVHIEKMIQERTNKRRWAKAEIVESNKAQDRSE